MPFSRAVVSWEIQFSKNLQYIKRLPETPALDHRGISVPHKRAWHFGISFQGLFHWSKLLYDWHTINFAICITLIKQPRPTKCLSVPSKWAFIRSGCCGYCVWVDCFACTLDISTNNISTIFFHSMYSYFLTLTFLLTLYTKTAEWVEIYQLICSSPLWWWANTSMSQSIQCQNLHLTTRGGRQGSQILSRCF